MYPISVYKFGIILFYDLEFIPPTFFLLSIRDWTEPGMTLMEAMMKLTILLLMWQKSIPRRRRSSWPSSLLRECQHSNAKSTWYVQGGQGNVKYPSNLDLVQPWLLKELDK